MTRKKPVPDMTYNVFGGTLSPTHSINQPRAVNATLKCTLVLFQLPDKNYLPI